MAHFYHKTIAGGVSLLVASGTLLTLASTGVIARPDIATSIYVVCPIMCLAAFALIGAGASQGRRARRL